MSRSTLRRSWLAGVVAAVLAVLAPGVAQAQPPSNDDFDNATVITALPGESTVNSTAATQAPDDPLSCYGYNSKSVWFRYTPTEDGILKATVSVPGDYPILSAYTGTRDALALVPGVCSFGSDSAETFHVTAGTTYHFMVGSNYNAGGDVTLLLRFVPPSPNDDIAGAERIPGLPTDPTGDLARAGSEPGEPVPSCDTDATQSVWYTYTPASPRWVSVFASSQFTPTLTIHRGSDMSEMDCRAAEAVFRAEVGQTYYIRVAAAVGEADRFYAYFRTAPALRPSVSIWPYEPTTLAPVQLTPSAGDQLNRPIVSGELRFGDGTSTRITGSDPVPHSYAADGEYQVELTVTTDDGRTGTGRTTVRVETHDVTVTGLTVPATARVDQTKPVTASVTNGRYDETVKVELFKQKGDYFHRVGTLTQWVPAGGTVQFPFAYTFGAEDVTAGTVTFKVVATLSVAEANYGDNEKLGTTTVQP